MAARAAAGAAGSAASGRPGAGAPPGRLRGLLPAWHTRRGASSAARCAIRSHSSPRHPPGPPARGIPGSCISPGTSQHASRSPKQQADWGLSGSGRRAFQRSWRRLLSLVGARPEVFPRLSAWICQGGLPLCRILQERQQSKAVKGIWLDWLPPGCTTLASRCPAQGQL